MAIKHGLLVWLLGVAFPLALLAAPQVSVSIDAEETIAIEMPNLEPHKVFTLSGPDRLVVDVPQAPLSASDKKRIALPRSYKGSLIKALRFGQFNTDTLRLVFDLAAPVKVVNTDIRRQGRQLTIVIAAEGAAPKKEAAKPLIVIDPGHGGVDPGTIAADGTREKDIVLQYAEALQEKLAESGKYRVMLTRDDDSFIKLRQRFEIARREKAALFISLHADAAPANVRGVSVYTLSEKSSDEEAEALAARENKSDVLAGIDLDQERKDVADILISLAQRETKNRSATLADLLVVALQSKVTLVPRAHRFAGFAVLKAPDIPSVLIELGFLSHRQDAKLLKSKSYRNKAVAGIASGIDAYFRHKKKSDGE